ncbi:MAG: hypothetical protein H6Q61_543 [Firmicutes bacterium]|nr:hypothetical protein [Bacillota bacterium]
MGRTFFSAVIALFMVFALAGCMKDGTAAHYTSPITSSEKTATERNGVHDGSTNIGRQDRTMGADWQTYDRYWNGYTTPGANTAGTLNRGQTVVGERTTNNLKRTAEGIVGGVENAGRDVAQDVRNTVDGTAGVTGSNVKK